MDESVVFCGDEIFYYYSQYCTSSHSGVNDFFFLFCKSESGRLSHSSLQLRRLLTLLPLS
jgi:hypothetical protein